MKKLIRNFKVKALERPSSAYNIKVTFYTLVSKQWNQHVLFSRFSKSHLNQYF